MKCQFQFPNNQKAIKNLTKLEGISEEDPKMILDERSEESLLDSYIKN